MPLDKTGFDKYLQYQVQYVEQFYRAPESAPQLVPMLIVTTAPHPFVPKNRLELVTKL